MKQVLMWDDLLRLIGRSDLTRQQKKTLRGQLFSGNYEAALKGYKKLMKGKGEEK